jgi:hypothetical protein
VALSQVVHLVEWAAGCLGVQGGTARGMVPCSRQRRVAWGCEKFQCAGRETARGVEFSPAHLDAEQAPAVGWQRQPNAAGRPAQTAHLAAAIQALMQEHADLRGNNADLKAELEAATHTHLTHRQIMHP